MRALQERNRFSPLETVEDLASVGIKINVLIKILERVLRFFRRPVDVQADSKDVARQPRQETMHAVVVGKALAHHVVAPETALACDFLAEDRKEAIFNFENGLALLAPFFRLRRNNLGEHGSSGEIPRDELGNIDALERPYERDGEHAVASGHLDVVLDGLQLGE